MFNSIMARKKFKVPSLLIINIFSFFKDIVVSNLFNIITFKYNMGIVTTI